jgi:hypothetical protein
VLNPLDLLYNKLETARQKDLRGASLMLRSGAVAADQIRDFVQSAETPEETKRGILKNLEKVLASRTRSKTRPR